MKGKKLMAAKPKYYSLVWLTSYLKTINEINSIPQLGNKPVLIPDHIFEMLEALKAEAKLKEELRKAIAKL